MTYLPPFWKKYPALDAYEFRDRELRARVIYVHTHAAEYMWGVIRCNESLPDFADLPPTAYVELAAGDTVGELALEMAFNAAMLAICNVQLEPPNRIEP